MFATVNAYPRRAYASALSCFARLFHLLDLPTVGGDKMRPYSGNGCPVIDKMASMSSHTSSAESRSPSKVRTTISRLSAIGSTCRAPDALAR